MGFPAQLVEDKIPLGFSTLMVGNFGLAMVFLVVVSLCVSWGIDPPLFTSLVPNTSGCLDCDLTSNARMMWVVGMMQAILIGALIWYTASIMGFIAAMRQR